MKLWALNVCVACILAGALDLFLPRQGSFKSIKTVLALYILVSVVSPAAGADWRGLADLSFETAAQPADYTAYVSDLAAAQLAQQLESRLADAGVVAQVRITAAAADAPAAVTLFTDQPEEALALAKELLDETAYTFDTAPPQT
ncbi:hypothetical protein [Candidatus Allofournierella merdavium]|uniref:hypothetical protein n=1 Tax=Candidatus Allofournierella merdavium TaxID=2838593 RepID=UPI00374F6CE4